MTTVKMKWLDCRSYTDQHLPKRTRSAAAASRHDQYQCANHKVLTPTAGISMHTQRVVTRRRKPLSLLYIYRVEPACISRENIAVPTTSAR